MVRIPLRPALLLAALAAACLPLAPAAAVAPAGTPTPAPATDAVDGAAAAHACVGNVNTVRVCVESLDCIVVYALGHEQARIGCQ